MLSDEGVQAGLDAWGIVLPRNGRRAERIAKLYDHARRALGYDVEARQFMTSGHPRIDGLSPLAATKSADVTRRVGRLLTELE